MRATKEELLREYALAQYKSIKKDNQHKALVSQYSQVRDQLEATRCQLCYGNGSQADNARYSIDMSSWECPECKGTGFHSEKLYLVIENDISMTILCVFKISFWRQFFFNE